MTTYQLPNACKWRLSGVAVLSLLGANQVVMACDLQQVHSYKIEANRLSETLLFIGRASGCSISFKPANTHEYMSQAIEGQMSVQEAMSMALSASDLETKQLENGSLTIRKRSVKALALP